MVEPKCEKNAREVSEPASLYPDLEELRVISLMFLQLYLRKKPDGFLDTSPFIDLLGVFSVC